MSSLVLFLYMPLFLFELLNGDRRKAWEPSMKLKDCPVSLDTGWTRGSSGVVSALDATPLPLSRKVWDANYAVGVSTAAQPVHYAVELK